MCSIDYELGILEKGLKELKTNHSETILNKFRLYLKILYSFKNRLHLLSHSDYSRISLKHFLPSLTALKFISNEHYICDIGAGAGFPSVPVKILRPEIEFTLFESVRKRAQFLEYLIEKLNLNGIYILNCRAEEYTDNGYEIILIRAAGKIKKLAGTVYHLLKPGGRAVFYKSPDINAELNEARREIEKYKFILHIKKIFTPVAQEALTLVFLQRQKT